eukprot:gene968-1145_t
MTDKKENLVLQKILEVTLDKSEASSGASAYPGKTGMVFLPDSAKQAQLLQLDQCDQYLQERLTIEGALANQLTYLGGSYVRSLNQPSFFSEKAKVVSGQILNFAVLVVTFPDMFGGMDIDLGTIGRELSSAVMSKRVSIGLLNQIAARLLEENREAYDAIMGQIVNATIGALQGRTYGDQKNTEFLLFQTLVGAGNPAQMKNHPLIQMITELRVIWISG